MKITDFETGARLRFKGFLNHGTQARKDQTATTSTIQREYMSKLTAMGFTHGTEFSIERKAPLGDPLVLKVKNYYLALRAGEAAILDVEKAD